MALLLICHFPLFAGAASQSCSPDFTLEVVPPVAFATGGYALYSQFRATVTAQCGFAGAIVFEVSGVPETVDAHFDYTSRELGSSATTAISTLLVVAEDNVNPGSYPLTITASGGGQVHTQTVELFVDNFTISADPTSRTVQRRQSTSYTITVTPLNGFVGNLYLQLHNLPKNATATFNPQTVIVAKDKVFVTTTLTVTTKGTPAGTYELVVSPYLWSQKAIVGLTVR